MTEVVFGYKILLDWYKELEREHSELIADDDNWAVMTDEGYVYYCTVIKELDTTGSLNILQINQLLAELKEEIANTLDGFKEKYKPFLPKYILLVPELYFLTWT